jgi:hypothetical protein
MSKILFQFTIILTLILGCRISGIAQEGDFGKLNIKIDDEPERSYQVQRALLYRQVSIKYDSTVLVQNKMSRDIYYVLRLLAGTFKKDKQDFFDIFINIGDSIPDSLTYTNSTNDIFISKNGKIQLFKSNSQNINGSIHIKYEKEKVVAGRLDLSFLIKNFLEIDRTEKFVLNGSFEVAAGDYRELSLGTTAAEKNAKMKRKQNLYIALLISLFVVAYFGFK